jgi:hypothetical protein
LCTGTFVSQLLEKPKKVFAVLAFPKMSFETHCPNQGTRVSKLLQVIRSKATSLHGSTTLSRSAPAPTRVLNNDQTKWRRTRTDDAK